MMINKPLKCSLFPGGPKQQEQSEMQPETYLLLFSKAVKTVPIIKT